VASPAPEVLRRRRLIAAAGGLLAAVVIVVVVVVLAGGGSAGSGTASEAAARLVPSDALAFVNLDLGRGRPAVRQALRVAGRLPDFPLLEGQGLSRLSQIVSGGHIVDVTADVSPWLGGEAAIALLNTSTSTAGSLLVLAVSDRARAQAFIRGQGARPAGSYRGHALLGYANGSQLVFTGGWLLVGQAASVRAALDVAAGAASSLATDATFQRAVVGESPDRVIDAYASVDGVRRVLSPQRGLLGALGTLLDQPALQGVALSLVPTARGAHVHIHSALDPSLVGIGAAAESGSGASFTPTLEGTLPAGATLLLDVTGLDRVAPEVLGAGSAAGVAGGLGPLLSRLGAALRSEGVNTSALVSIFHREAAVGIIGSGAAPTLVIVARAPNQSQVATELAQVEVPLAHLFVPATQTSGAAPTFNDRTVGGVSAHQLALSTGLQFDYAVFRGLVVISTGLNGIAAVAQHTATLAQSAAYAGVLGHHPAQVTSLVYANLASLLGLGRTTGVAGSSTLSRLSPDLARLGATGLVSTRARDSSTTDLTITVG
jgi:hypothetical protein